MTNAIGIVSDVQINFQSGPGGTQTLNYFIFFHGTVTDGVTNTPFGDNVANTNSPLAVPIDTKINKINRLIREAMAAGILTVSGLVIDPDDIYIPFGG